MLNVVLQSNAIIKETVIKSNEVLDKQIKSLEDVFNKIKDSLLVHTYREMFSRWFTIISFARSK